MDLRVLKVYAATYVVESNSSNENKLELLNFIKESDKDHILSLLSTGSMNLNENVGMLVETEYIIEDSIAAWNAKRVIKKGINKGDNPFRALHKGVDTYGKTKAVVDTAKGAAVGAVVGAAVGAAVELGLKMLSIRKACKGKKGEEFNKCSRAWHNKRIGAQINLLQRGLSNCKGTKDPAKCKGKIQVKINKLKSKMK